VQRLVWRTRWLEHFLDMAEETENGLS